MTREQWKLVFAGALGNVLEWYDFAVYGLFAAIIGMHFFPSDNPSTSLIASFGAFAAGYLARPVGSIFFGHIGDRYGHKTALTASVMMMAVPTFLVGCLPDFASIGILAPILLVALRLAQGLSVGGEYTTSVSFLAENAETKHRAIFASWSSIGSASGILLGSGVFALIVFILGTEAVQEWAWRLPFLFGIVIAAVGLYLRRQIQEADPPDHPPRYPMAECVEKHFGEMTRLGAIVIGISLGYYLAFIYAAAWLHQDIHVAEARVIDINTFNMLAMVITIPIAAVVSDRVGRRPVLLAGYGAMVIFSYPLFWLMQTGSTAGILFAQLTFAVLLGVAAGGLPALLAEISPPRVRVTLMSFAYNVVQGIVGGTAPMIAVFLVTRTHLDLSPAIYLSLGTLISWIVVFRLKETRGTDLKSGLGEATEPEAGKRPKAPAHSD